MTVEEMTTRMSAIEYRRWNVYYARKAQRAELEELKAKSGRKG